MIKDTREARIAYKNAQEDAIKKCGKCEGGFVHTDRLHVGYCQCLLAVIKAFEPERNVAEELRYSS